MEPVDTIVFYNGLLAAHPHPESAIIVEVGSFGEWRRAAARARCAATHQFHALPCWSDGTECRRATDMGFGKVVCFEPGPTNFENAKAKMDGKIDENHLVLQKVVGNTTGELACLSVSLATRPAWRRQTVGPSCAAAAHSLYLGRHLQARRWCSTQQVWLGPLRRRIGRVGGATPGGGGAGGGGRTGAMVACAQRRRRAAAAAARRACGQAASIHVLKGFWLVCLQGPCKTTPAPSTRARPT